jgi:hypothetical protein
LVKRILAIDGYSGLDIETGQIGFQELDVGFVVVGDEDAAFFGGRSHVVLDG